MEKMVIVALNPSVYDCRKSFYGKAKVFKCGKTIVLRSYDTMVCAIYRGKFYKLWDGYSATTMRHINSFLYEYGIDGGGEKWWDDLPMASKSVKNSIERKILISC